MDTKWVRLTTWHALRPDKYSAATTFCGRNAEDHEVVDSPSGPQCVICMRIVGRLQDDHAKAAD